MYYVVVMKGIALTDIYKNFYGSFIKNCNLLDFIKKRGKVSKINNQWNADLYVAQVRFARPTDKLVEMERFYCEGVGLKKVGSFQGHNGYTGLMIGLPDTNYHLEFTQHEDGSPYPAPTKDNLLVLYMPERKAIERIAHKLEEMGYPEVEPERKRALQLKTRMAGVSY